MKNNSIIYILFIVLIMLSENPCQASERAWIKDYRLGDVQPSIFNGLLCSKIVIDIPNEAQALRTEIDDFHKNKFLSCSVTKKDTFAGRNIIFGEVSFLRNQLAYLRFKIPRNTYEKDEFSPYRSKTHVGVDSFSNEIILLLNFRYNSVCNPSPVTVREKGNYFKLVRWECNWLVDTDQIKLTGYQGELVIEMISKEYEEIMAKQISIRDKITSMVSEVKNKIQAEEKATSEAAKKARISKDI